MVSFGKGCPNRAMEGNAHFRPFGYSRRMPTRTLFESDYLMIVKETHDFKNFSDFLLEIFEQSSSKLRDTPSLFEFMHQNPLFESLDREKAKKTIGTEFSGKVLYLKGGHSSRFEEIETYINQKLLLNNPPYFSIDEVMQEKMGINRVWDYEGSIYQSKLLFMVFAPNLFRLEQPEITGSDLSLQVSAFRKPSGSVKVSVIGKNGDRTTFRKLIKLEEQEWTNGIFTRTLQIDEESALLLLWLFYNDDLVDKVSYNRPDKALQRTLWLRTIIKTIDPGYIVLERWISGMPNETETKRMSSDFEKGVSILFSLCGLNSLHVGESYELATQESRARQQSSRMGFPVDLFAWAFYKSDSLEILYLGQCNLAGTGDKLLRKINDIASAAKVADNILSNHLLKPRILPLVITNRTRGDMEYEFKMASRKNVKLVSKEDLLYFLEGVRNDDLSLHDEVRRILED